MSAKILVVDDDPNVQRLLSFTLKQEGYDVVVAGDGAEGFKLWAQDPPALILLDVMLPKLDGYQVAAQDPRRGGRRGPRPDHHAHRRERGRAEDPRPAGRRGRLPGQALPPGRAPGPDQEPAGAVRAPTTCSSAGRRSAASSRSTAPRVAWGRRRSRSTPRSRSTASWAARSASSTPTSSSATTGSSWTSAWTARASSTSSPRRRSTPTSSAVSLVKHDSGIDLLLAPPVARDGRARHEGAPRPDPRGPPRPLRLRRRRRRQAPRRPRTSAIFDAADALFVVMTADLSCLKNVRLVLETLGHIGYDGRAGQAGPQPLERVHGHQRRRTPRAP